MISAAEIVRRILGAPAPVLLPDTCALLDLMRDPTRENFSSDQIFAAKRLLQMAQSRPKTLWIPIAAQVLTERASNHENIKKEAESKIFKLEEHIKQTQRIMAAHGLHTSAIAPSLVATDFPAIASTLVDEFFVAGPHLRKPRDIDRRANARMAANIAPSKKGQQTKDCIVIESYLSLARLLRQSGGLHKVAFLTTNTRDYSDPARTGSVHPDLQAEFDALNVGYCVNFQMAEHYLF